MQNSCNFLNEFSQILCEFVNIKDAINVFLLKLSDVKIKQPNVLGKTIKRD